MRPCRCRFPAHVASATDLIAVFEFDPPQTDLSDVAELGAASTFFAVHGFASLVILIADLLSTANTALPSMLILNSKKAPVGVSVTTLSAGAVSVPSSVRVKPSAASADSVL